MDVFFLLTGNEIVNVEIVLFSASTAVQCWAAMNRYTCISELDRRTMHALLKIGAIYICKRNTQNLCIGMPIEICLYRVVSTIILKLMSWRRREPQNWKSCEKIANTYTYICMQANESITEWIRSYGRDQITGLQHQNLAYAYAHNQDIPTEISIT